MPGVPISDEPVSSKHRLFVVMDNELVAYMPPDALTASSNLAQLKHISRSKSGHGFGPFYRFMNFPDTPPEVCTYLRRDEYPNEAKS